MIPDDREDREAMAGEYVLGTLDAEERRAFDEGLRVDEDLRQLVAAWERRLNPLAGALPERSPPAAVWREIERRIAPAPAPAPAAGWWDSVVIWRFVGLAASAAVLALVAYLGVVLNRAPVAPLIAVLNDAQGQAAFVLSLDAEHGVLHARSVRRVDLAAGRSLELWVVPRESQPPRSLGVLPEPLVLAAYLPPNLASVARTAAAFAVSLEPAGGSPTGQPTGPVLYSGPAFPPSL